MKTITYTKLTAWIRKQPLDRAINMSESTITAECGCIMIQFAKDNGIDCKYVGFHSFFNKTKDDAMLDTQGSALIYRCMTAKVQTYADVIQLLYPLPKAVESQQAH